MHNEHAKVGQWNDFKTPFNEKQSRRIQNCLSEIIIIGLILQPLRLINISFLFIAEEMV